MPGGRILVAGQIALSLSVLIVAGLFLRSFTKLAGLDPGFDHDHLLQFDIGFLESSGYNGALASRPTTRPWTPKWMRKSSPAN
jgi:hypothetical protein